MTRDPYEHDAPVYNGRSFWLGVLICFTVAAVMVSLYYVSFWS